MAVLFSVLVASCTSTGETPVSLGVTGYAADAAIPADSLTAAEDPSALAAGQAQPLAMAEGNPELPAAVAYMPSPNPGVDFALAPPTGVEEIAGSTPQPLQANTPATVAQAAEAATPTAKPQESQPQPIIDNPVYVTATETPAAKPQAYAAPKKKGFLASLFGSSPAQAAPSPVVDVNPTREAVKPVITLASAEANEKPLIADIDEVSRASVNGALPGVRQTALFEIRRKSGIDDESDVDLHEDEGGLYQVASAAGLARLAPNGLLRQTESVDVACLKPSLVRVLKTIEGHYGKKMVVTSGYRDPTRNRRARGARNSLHMYCAAADIQIPGVSKWELASYVRSMPGRGGVGTYCHTESVHIDVGPERDWNWRCRRRK